MFQVFQRAALIHVHSASVYLLICLFRLRSSIYRFPVPWILTPCHLSLLPPLSPSWWPLGTEALWGLLCSWPRSPPARWVPHVWSPSPSGRPRSPGNQTAHSTAAASCRIDRVALPPGHLRQEEEGREMLDREFKGRKQMMQLCQIWRDSRKAFLCIYYYNIVFHRLDFSNGMIEREQTITLQTHLFTHPHTHKHTGDCIYTHAHFSRGLCCIPVLLPVRFILQACSSQWNNLLQAVGLKSSEK